MTLSEDPWFAAAAKATTIRHSLFEGTFIDDDSTSQLITNSQT